MQTTVSIAEARNNFAALIHKVEENAQPIEVTRRGKPVAVILSADEYAQLIRGQSKRGFAAVEAFREKWADHLDDSVVDLLNERDKTPAPDVNIWEL